MLHDMFKKLQKLNMTKMTYKIPTLPLPSEIETSKILKKAIAANKVIAELKGMAPTIPNQSLLINTLSIQESKDSSEIENIVTTHDELFRFDKNTPDSFSPAAKEIYRYNEALFYGFSQLKKRPITNNLLIEIAKIITERNSGLRNTPGTTLKNGRGEIIYTPPQNTVEIQEHMKNLEKFINDSELSDFDPLVKMAIIHHQFESIHPFFDGNGRTGRILNILYLISQNILEIPILCLSRYITQNKKEYYDLLQNVRDENAWEEWILFILKALESTAKQTIFMIEEIKKLMSEYKKVLREQTKIYSHELINNLFSHPYTKIEFVSKDTRVNRQTASRHLKQLESLGLLTSHENGRNIYYINTKLLKLFTDLN
jgi:Fic family protein